MGEVESVLVGDPGVAQAVVVVAWGSGVVGIGWWRMWFRLGVRFRMGWLCGGGGGGCRGTWCRRVGVVLEGGLPLTVNGKLDRRALPAPALESRCSGRRVDCRGGGCGAVFAGVRGAERVGLDDDFFALGGNADRDAGDGAVGSGSWGLRCRCGSCSRRRRWRRWRLAWCRMSVVVGRVPALVAGPRPAQVPLSLAQQRMWFLNRLDPESAAYNIPVAIRLSGWLDVAALVRRSGMWWRVTRCCARCIRSGGGSGAGGAAAGVRRRRRSGGAGGGGRAGPGRRGSCRGRRSM